MRSPNFRLALQDEFEARCARNQQYSLRAFAKSLGMPSGAVSEIMRGKRSLTKNSIRKLGEGIRLTSKAIDQYIQEFERAKKARKSEKAAMDIELPAKKYDQISVDEYHYLSNHIYDSILGLIKLKGFKPSIKKIADTFEMDPLEVEICVDRLVRLDFLSIKKGQWKDNRDFTLHELGKNKFTKKAYSQFVSDVHKESLRYYKSPKNGQYILTHALPIAKEDFDDLIKLWVKLTNQFDKRAERSSQKYDQYYQYMVTFFPRIPE